MKYKLNPNVVLVTILDESMLVTVGNKMNCVENMRGVNETGAYYWKLLEKGMEVDKIISQAMKDYDISEDRARPSFERYFDTLCNAGCITIEE